MTCPVARTSSVLELGSRLSGLELLFGPAVLCCHITPTYSTVSQEPPGPSPPGEVPEGESAGRRSCSKVWS